MKAQATAVWLALVAVAGAEGEGARTRTWLQEEHRYTGVPPETEDVSSPLVAEEEEPVLMEAFTVTESIARRDLAKTLAQQEARQKAKEFSRTRGGQLASRVIGRYEAEVGIWPSIMEQSYGTLRGQDFVLRVDFLKLNW